jgi:hypothetical protein
MILGVQLPSLRLGELASPALLLDALVLVGEAVVDLLAARMVLLGANNVAGSGALTFVTES